MLIKKQNTYDLRENLVTDEKIYLNRRSFIKGLSGVFIYPSFTFPLSSNNELLNHEIVCNSLII